MLKEYKFNVSKFNITFAKCFSKSVRVIAVVLLEIFVWVLAYLYMADVNCEWARNTIYFLIKWKETFLTASVCVWGFILSSAIFLLGRLEEIYYGTSLKRIIIMCFSKWTVVAYIVLYTMLVPAIVWTYYEKMWLINGWLQIVNYAYSAGLILFISCISLRGAVIELIKDRTVQQIRDNQLEHKIYPDEQFAVLNMIRNLDYNDKWQCDRLQDIIVDMMFAAIETDRVYVMYNVIWLLIQEAGFETKEKKNRIIDILNGIIKGVIDGSEKKNVLFWNKKSVKRQNDFEEKQREAVVGIILPILQVYVDETEGKWISQLIAGIPWGMRKETCLILMFGAEYLYECGAFCTATINELLDVYMELNNPGCISEEEIESLRDEIFKCWLNLNIYNHQGMKKEDLCDDFIKDYININERLCTTEIFLDVQARMLKR